MTAVVAVVGEEPPRTRGDVWHRLRRDRLALVGAVLIGVLGAAAVLAPVVTAHDPMALDGPSRAGPSAQHWFGTDVLGRDLFSRVIYGARVSLRIGLVAVVIATLIGLIVGAAAGFYGGVVDGLLMRTTDVLLTFPYLLAAMVLITVMGRGEWTVMAVLGLLGWMPIARLFRAGVLQVRSVGYVEAARAAGCPDWRIIARHVVPNAIQPVIVYATLFVGLAMVAEAALSFLGVGVEEPTPAWGQMISQGRTFLFSSPHLLFFPAAAVSVAVIGFLLVGEGLRNTLDPRRR
jgi:ABC-type dipeptide/oligopeptide/nickel transport system permease subunit